MSREIEPVGITSTGGRVSSPSRITDSLPKARSIWPKAASSALLRSVLLRSAAETAMSVHLRVGAVHPPVVQGPVCSPPPSPSGCGARDDDMSEHLHPLHPRPPVWLRRTPSASCGQQ